MFSPPLALESHRDGEAHVIVSVGEVDYSTAPVLSSALNHALTEDEAAVIVDLSGTSFIDSTGLSVLLNALRRLTRQGRRLALVCDEGGPVHQLLALTDLVETFALHRSRESAVAGGRDLIGRTRPTGR